MNQTIKAGLIAAAIVLAALYIWHPWTPPPGLVNGGAVDYVTCRTVEGESADLGLIPDSTRVDPSKVPEPSQLAACYSAYPPRLYAP